MFLVAYDLFVWKILCTRTTLKYFIKTSTWPLLIHPRLTITQVLFHFHFNKVELCVIILRLAYSYWMVFCNAVNTCIDKLASVIGFPVFTELPHIYYQKKQANYKIFFLFFQKMQYNNAVYVLSNDMIINKTYWEQDLNLK